MTVDKVTFITTRQHLRRQEEPYFRLTPSQLSELLSEYEQVRTEDTAFAPLLHHTLSWPMTLPGCRKTHIFTTNAMN